MKTSREAFEDWHDAIFDVSAATAVKNEYGYPENGHIQMQWRAWQACDARWREKLQSEEVVKNVGRAISRAYADHGDTSDIANAALQAEKQWRSSDTASLAKEIADLQESAEADSKAKDAEIAELRGLLVEAVDMLNHADRRFPPIHHAAYPYFRQTLAKITTALAGKEQHFVGETQFNSVSFDGDTSILSVTCSDGRECEGRIEGSRIHIKQKEQPK